MEIPRNPKETSRNLLSIYTLPQVHLPASDTLVRSIPQLYSCPVLTSPSAQDNGLSLGIIFPLSNQGTGTRVRA